MSDVVVPAVVGLIWLVIGSYFLWSAADLAARPRRGTALRLSQRGYRILGAFGLALAALQLVMIVT
jgi:hypothetical protein